MLIASFAAQGEDASQAQAADADLFKSAFRHHPAGVAVVTADAGKGPVGLTATSVISISAQPPVLAFSTSELSSSAPTILEAETVVVHMIDRERLNLAVLCATSGIDRFADTALWDRLDTGETVFTSAPVWIRGRVIRRFPVGGSTLIVVEALEIGGSDFGGTSSPLVYHDRTWHQLSDSSALDQ